MDPINTIGSVCSPFVYHTLVFNFYMVNFVPRKDLNKKGLADLKPKKSRKKARPEEAKAGDREEAWEWR